MIYAPAKRLFAIYTSAGEYTDRHIISGFTA
jgi:hypothetical protein